MRTVINSDGIAIDDYVTALHLANYGLLLLNPTLKIPKAGRTTGVIVARISSTTYGDYLSGVTLYLGDFLPLEPGSEYLITFKEQESPHEEVNEDGYVIFDNVSPGEYALIVWSPLRSTVASDLGGERELRIKLEAGQVLNLGEISVQWP